MNMNYIHQQKVKIVVDEGLSPKTPNYEPNLGYRENYKTVQISFSHKGYPSSKITNYSIPSKTSIKSLMSQQKK